VVFHYEGLRLLSRWVTLDLLPARVRIVSLIFGQLLLHGAEIACTARGVASPTVGRPRPARGDARAFANPGLRISVIAWGRTLRLPGT